MIWLAIFVTTMLVGAFIGAVVGVADFAGGDDFVPGFLWGLLGTFALVLSAVLMYVIGVGLIALWEAALA